LLDDFYENWANQVHKRLMHQRSDDVVDDGDDNKLAKLNDKDVDTSRLEKVSIPHLVSIHASPL
jgi:hypothetical protein